MMSVACQTFLSALLLASVRASVWPRPRSVVSLGVMALAPKTFDAVASVSNDSVGL